MIQPNELRLGNIVQGKKGKWATVQELRIIPILKIHGGCGRVADYEYDEIFGIELTAEILNRCGFKPQGPINNKVALPNAGPGDLDGYTLFLDQHIVDIARGPSGDFRYIVTEFTDDYGDHYQTLPLPSLHFLQNIYFFNELRELTVNL